MLIDEHTIYKAVGNDDEEDKAFAQQMNVKMWCIDATAYYSAIKRIQFCHLQQHGWILRALRYAKYADRERQILYNSTYMRNLKIQQTSEYNKKKQTHRYRG